MSRTLRALVALALLLPVAQAQRGVLPLPNADSGPTEIEVGIYVNDIIKVDGAEQLLTADFVLVQRWRYPGQAGGEPRSVPSDSVWMPNVIFTVGAFSDVPCKNLLGGYFASAFI